MEKEFVIPLKREWSKVADYKRSRRAVITIKEFIAKHMKVPNRDIEKVKLDSYLNNEVWSRGARTPPIKIKVRAKKEGDIVKVEFAQIPQHVIFSKAKHARLHVKPTKKEEPKVEKKEQTTEEKTAEKEKEMATAEAKQKEAKQEAKASEQREKSKDKSTPKRAVSKGH